MLFKIALLQKRTTCTFYAPVSIDRGAYCFWSVCLFVCLPVCQETLTLAITSLLLDGFDSYLHRTSLRIRPSYTPTFGSLGKRSRSPWPFFLNFNLAHKMKKLSPRIFKLHMKMHLNRIYNILYFEVTRSKVKVTMTFFLKTFTLLIKRKRFPLGSLNFICRCTIVTSTCPPTLRSVGQRSRSPWPLIENLNLLMKSKGFYLGYSNFIYRCALMTSTSSSTLRSPG